MAPEQFDSTQYGRPTTKADIWAFGCVLIALLQGT
jgi:serine/threonine protein kinase